MRVSPEKFREFTINMMLLLGTLVVMFIFLEVGLRGAVFFNRQKSFETLKQHLPQPKNGETQDLGEVIQPSQYDDIVYELRPNQSVKFRDVLVTTNSQGFRNKPLSLEKPGDVARVIVLGDSHAFGWGVTQEKVWPNVLEGMLNQKFPQKKWEVIDMAVPGYNTAMEIATLEKKALQYRPDIVIVEFIGNDLDLPNFLLEAPDCFSLKQSFIIEFIRKKLAVLKTDVDLVAAPLASDGRFEHDSSKVPERYRHMVGLSAFNQSMTRLKEMQEKGHFEVVFCASQDAYVIPHFLKYSYGLCKKLGFHMVIDIQKIEPALVRNMIDTHPNALAHQRKAGVLLNFMANERIPGSIIAGQKYSETSSGTHGVDMSDDDVKRITADLIGSVNKGDLTGASKTTSIDSVQLAELKKLFENIQLERLIKGEEIEMLHRDCYVDVKKGEEPCFWLIQEDSDFFAFNTSQEYYFRVMINGKVWGMLTVGLPANGHQEVSDPRIVKLSFMIDKKGNDTAGYTEILERFAPQSKR
jgi:hypothetical protein